MVLMNISPPLPQISGAGFGQVLVVAALTLTLCACRAHPEDKPPPAGRWLAGDFHNHTVLTDGGHTAEEVFAKAFGFGLDWVVNSEHGGAFGRDPAGQRWSADTERLGAPPAGGMWRWQSLRRYSWPLVVKARVTFPDKLILQGYEWNLPSHDHASVAIVGQAEEGGLAVARHAYLFDRDDAGTGADGFLGVSGKESADSHERALAGVRWLKEQYPEASYVLVNHPSRRLRYTVADLRDLNDAAPEVAFGFEGMPGHQKASARGGYGDGPFTDAAGRDITERARTFGGADYMLAKVGGPWDALLGEGRRFFVFFNSDFHDTGGDFWPGEYARNHVYAEDADGDGRIAAMELLQGMRSGNVFIAQGGLIDGLAFSARAGGEKTVMGGTLDVHKGEEVEVRILFRSPARNNHGDAVAVDHVDLIMGEIWGRARKYREDGGTANPGHASDANESTRVLKTFTVRDWEEDSPDAPDGWRSMVFTVHDVGGDGYLRLRGTNLGCGVAGETDEACNPLNDDLMAPNSETKAYADLWFYSNPIFLRITE